MATYKGILTNNGKALIAGATVSNKINYSHIAVGDGNGSVPVPSETRTALINEKARIALNVVEINPNNTNQIVCEAIIPSNVGGFYIRELGLYAGNTMVVNSSYPPTYKPLADEGSAREINIKLVINIQNAEVIAMYLDDSLIYATREWVNNNYIRRNELIDNLVTDDASKPLTANQGKKLQDEKFAKTGGSVSGSVQLTSDNTVLTVGNDKDIGFVKKQGFGGVLAIAKDRVFRIVSGNKLEISADASDTFTDLLSLNGLSLNSTIYPGQVLTLSANTEGATAEESIESTVEESQEEAATSEETTSSTNAKMYYVHSGDSLYRIAHNHGISLSTLLEWNHLSVDSIIHPGQGLMVSEGSSSSTEEAEETAASSESTETTYTVQQGDGLWRIAKNHGLTLDELKSLNQLTSNIIQPGQVLIVSKSGV